VTAYVCTTCGTQFAPSEDPPPECPICLDERQFVNEEGQQWTTLAELVTVHRARIEELARTGTG
jgi:hypothetical protein